MKRYQIILASLLIIGFAGAGINDIVSTKNEVKLKEIQLKSTDSELQLLENKYDNINIQLQQSNTDKEKLQKEKEQLDQERQRLEKEVAAKKEAQRIAAEKTQSAAQAPVAVISAPKVSAASIGNCGDNMYKQYIYQKESGCNTAAVNPIGCFGIGQSCPRSKIAHCGTDFACQDAWFSNYAVTRYGSWEGAYNFWLKNHWW